MKATSILAVATVLLCSEMLRAQAPDQSAQPTAPRETRQVKGETDANDGNASLITLRVLSASLRDNAGSPIGRIEDLLVDPGSGRIEFVLVAPFFPTNNSKIMPIPWKALKQGSDGLSTSFGGNQVFMVNVARTKLEQAPAFERYRWTHSNDDTWRQKVLRFYIDDGETAAGGTGSGSRRLSGAGSSDEGASSVTNTPVYSNDFIGPRLNTGSPNTREVQRPVDSSRSDTPLPIGARR